MPSAFLPLLLEAQAESRKKATSEKRASTPCFIEKLVDDLSNGYIVGVARGNSEHGPRALGNRSIICNPLISDMKDILNAKVKHREWVSKIYK